LWPDDPQTIGTLQEWFGEAKLADLSPNFDIIKVQPAAYRRPGGFLSALLDRQKSA
jgi:hypothetical protein